MSLVQSLYIFSYRCIVCVAVTLNNCQYYILIVNLHGGYYVHILVTRIEMASNHGHIEEFNNQLEDWCSYTERLQNCFIANDIKSEGKQRAAVGFAQRVWPVTT